MFTEEQQELINKWKEKADKWDALDEKISKFYGDDDSEGDLSDIGEIAAMAFGYL